LGWQRGRLLPLPQEARRQLVFFAWLRLPIVTAALVSTLLFHLVFRPEAVTGNRIAPLYALMGGAYLLSFLNLAALSFIRSASTLALIQFGGDVLVETALLVVLSSEEAAVAFVVALYFLTTLLACSYLDRVQGSAFATGAFLLLSVVHVLGRYELLPATTLRGEPPLADLTDWDLFLRLCIYVLTFCGTAWLVGLRQERLRAMGDRLRSVADDLAELQAFNEHVIRSMSTGLVTTDPDGLVTYANGAAETLLGRSRDELRGRRLHDVLGWQEQAEEDAGLLGPDRSACRLSREVILDGRRLSLNVGVSRLQDRDGRTLGRLHLLEDVTELRSLEHEVRLKEKMAAIGEMAAGIAHEIRNPLASISGSVQMLQRQLSLEDDEGRLMGIVLRESQRLDQTVREFLEFARPRPSRPRRVDVAELARDTLTLLQNSDEVREHHDLVGPESEGVEALADPDQLKQVVWNLCRNALQAMPEGGTLRLTVERRDDECVLTVEDTGVGMSPEMRRRAFQPLAGEFERGIGLGLAIVYRIVKDHGGSVRIDPEREQGTRIDVHLPSAEQAGRLDDTRRERTA
jgi:two-component system sensor histidine kinase PilS (NtrC family)